MKTTTTAQHTPDTDDYKAQRDNLLAALKKADDLIDALMPGVQHIALQDYRALNETPIAIRRAIAEAEGGAS